MLARILDKFAQWALSKNEPGSYAGETDKRWAYVIETNGSPYLTRVLLPRIRIPMLGIDFRPMLHHFHRPDIDKHPHSHPWVWGASLLLSGAYEESRVVDGEIEWNNFVGEYAAPTIRRLVTRFNFLTHRDYHKVEVLHGDVWTLFVAGPQTSEDREAWGFLVKGTEHVPWREYLALVTGA